MKLLLLVTEQQVACIRVQLQPVDFAVMVKCPRSHTTARRESLQQTPIFFKKISIQPEKAVN